MSLENLLRIIREENRKEYTAEIFFTTNDLPEEAYYIGSYVKIKHRAVSFWYSSLLEPKPTEEVVEFSRYMELDKPSFRIIIRR